MAQAVPLQLRELLQLGGLLRALVIQLLAPGIQPSVVLPLARPLAEQLQQVPEPIPTHVLPGMLLLPVTLRALLRLLKATVDR